MSTGYVVSIVPRELKIEKPGLYPGVWTIPKPEPGKFTLLEVKNSVYYRYVGEDATPDKSGSIKLECPGPRIAQSIAEDFINAQFGVITDGWPGIGWFAEKPTAEQLATKIKELARYQIAWFDNLTKLADDEWQRTHQHKFITDLQRMAARELGLDREWAHTPKPPVKCPACGSSVDANVAICKTCRCIMDPNKVKEFKFAS